MSYRTTTSRRRTTPGSPPATSASTSDLVFQFYTLIPSLTAQESIALLTDLAEAPRAPPASLKAIASCSTRATSSWTARGSRSADRSEAPDGPWPAPVRLHCPWKTGKVSLSCGSASVKLPYLTE